MGAADVPFGKLRFLYTGTDDFDKDYAYYYEVLGAQRVWYFEHFEARVAAFRVGDGPLLIVADHRPGGTCLLLYEVPKLKAAMRNLEKRGWLPDGEEFEIPNGPCITFKSPAGLELALFEDVRPNAMEESFEDPENDSAVRS